MRVRWKVWMRVGVSRHNTTWGCGERCGWGWVWAGTGSAYLWSLEPSNQSRFPTLRFSHFENRHIRQFSHWLLKELHSDIHLVTRRVSTKFTQIPQLLQTQLWISISLPVGYRPNSLKFLSFWTYSCQFLNGYPGYWYYDITLTELSQVSNDPWMNKQNPNAHRSWW